MNDNTETKLTRLLSLTECKRILNQNGNRYSDEEILKIRDYLMMLAELQYTDYKSKQDETGDLICKSLDR